jgi:hypothetical protein
MLEVKKRTLKFRSLTASICLRILTPKFYNVAKKTLANYEDALVTPRPSTRLIHAIYGEKTLSRRGNRNRLWSECY